jgi:hypothetical protein
MYYIRFVINIKHLSSFLSEQIMQFHVHIDIHVSKRFVLKYTFQIHVHIKITSLSTKRQQSNFPHFIAIMSSNSFHSFFLTVRHNYYLTGGNETGQNTTKRFRHLVFRPHIEKYTTSKLEMYTIF